MSLAMALCSAETCYDAASDVDECLAGSLMFVPDGINFFLRQLTAAFWIVIQVVCVFLGGFAGVVTERRDRRYLRALLSFRASCVCSLAVQVGRWFFL